MLPGNNVVCSQFMMLFLHFSFQCSDDGLSYSCYGSILIFPAVLGGAAFAGFLFLCVSWKGPKAHVWRLKESCS